MAVGEPSFGNVGPFAVGLALFAMVFAGSQYTGTAINPARAFAPAVVYQCYWNQVWLYCIAGQEPPPMCCLPCGSSLAVESLQDHRDTGGSAAGVPGTCWDRRISHLHQLLSNLLCTW